MVPTPGKVCFGLQPKSCGLTSVLWGWEEKLWRQCGNHNQGQTGKLFKSTNVPQVAELRKFYYI